jgi:hypothetical protein
MLAFDHKAESDAGPARPGTERLCIATRTVKPVSDMVRFVVGPDGSVVPDIKRRLPGRGVWVTATRAAIATAIARRAFGRSFRREVKVAPNLIETTERLIEGAALDALGIAYKAGQVVLGFGKVAAALEHKPVVALVHAADASPDGVRKLNAAAKRRLGAPAQGPAKARPDIDVIDMFTSTQLGLALGRPDVVHAALLAGAASDRFLGRCRELLRFRTATTDV